VFDPGLASGSKPPAQPYIITIGEREPDIAAIAAPVFGPQKRLRGALALSGPAARFSDDLIPAMSARLLAAAADLTRRLGGDTTLFDSWDAAGRSAA